jgi:hypothetical protein
MGRQTEKVIMGDTVVRTMYARREDIPKWIIRGGRRYELCDTVPTAKITDRLYNTINDHYQRNGIYPIFKNITFNLPTTYKCFAVYKYTGMVTKI